MRLDTQPVHPAFKNSAMRYRMIPVCKHLELRMAESDESSVLSYLFEIAEPDTTDKERREYIMAILHGGSAPDPLYGRPFEPYCLKSEDVCITMGGVNRYPPSIRRNGKIVRPLVPIISNLLEMDCPDSEKPDYRTINYERLQDFVVSAMPGHIKQMEFYESAKRIIQGILFYAVDG
ncbi:MAG: hypothetical protein ABIE22_04820 [archaeon]